MAADTAAAGTAAAGMAVAGMVAAGVVAAGVAAAGVGEAVGVGEPAGVGVRLGAGVRLGVGARVGVRTGDPDFIMDRVTAAGCAYVFCAIIIGSCDASGAAGKIRFSKDRREAVFLFGLNSI